MKRIAYLIFLSLIAFSCAERKEKVDYVNNRIGNISHLLVPTYPTMHLPNSMLRINPDHNEFTTDRRGGIPLNTPSDRQVSVLMLMPFANDKSHIKPHYAYRYDHEQTAPYRYSVYFDDFGVDLEAAPAAHSALFVLRFEEQGGRYIQLRSGG